MILSTLTRSSCHMNSSIVSGPENRLAHLSLREMHAFVLSMLHCDHCFSIFQDPGTCEHQKLFYDHGSTSLSVLCNIACFPLHIM